MSRPNYGIDAPGVAARLTLAGIGCAGGALVLNVDALAWPASALVVTAALMVASSKWGKIRQREWLLDRVAWRGGECVLDAGCGRGLLLCAAARRVPNGRAVGVDVWQTGDQTGNSPQATRANAGAEGVRPRIDVDRRRPRLAVSRRGIRHGRVEPSDPQHRDDGGRVSALRELARVVKAGGRLLVQDTAHTRRYADVFREAGLTSVRRHMPHAMLFPPTPLVDATMP